jgi:hypothetical protein
MRQTINGRIFDIPTDSSGMIDSDHLRRVAGIPADRSLVLKRTDGSNYMLNPRGKILVNPGEDFSDIPNHVRGIR